MRILVVEDNHILARILADYLSERGHRVVPAYEGGLGTIFSERQDFDVILIDLVLLDELSTRLEALGVDAVLRKPFSFHEIDDALARLR